MTKQPRCINIDWLEVYALEPITAPHTIQYWQQQGFGVIDRGYGTRIYEQMFTLVGRDDFPLLEVRRQPKTNSVLPIYATHIRFVNRTCYFDNAGQIMKEFLERYGYQFVSVSRIDICLDFEKFDSGDIPEKFLRRYVGHKYAKINQSQASTHFDDLWSRRDFNSFSWGSKNSDISTKMYDKTLELYDESLGSFRKPYIIQSWFAAGLIDDPLRVIKRKTDGTEYRPKIWRLEFSIKGNVKGWFTYRLDGDSKKIRSVKNTLDTYLNRTALLPIFDLLQQHYFHFKKYIQGKSKYDCPDKQLFTFTSEETFYRVDRPSSPNAPSADILRLFRYLNTYLQSHYDPSVQKAGQIIIEKIKQEDGSRLNPNPYSALEYKALQAVIALRLQGNTEDPALLAEDLLHLLKSNELF